MGILADSIRSAIRDERYVFGAHADERLRERRILGWQVVAGLDQATLLRERPDGTPHPVAEFEQTLPERCYLQGHLGMDCVRRHR